MGKALGTCGLLALLWSVAFTVLVSTVVTMPKRLAAMEPDAVGREYVISLGLVGVTFFIATLATSLVLAACYHELKYR